MMVCCLAIPKELPLVALSGVDLANELNASLD